jgi:hypothetical protein
MSQAVWKREADGLYLSHHLLVTYFNRHVPIYAIRRNPYGTGWVILQFTQTIGTYKRLLSISSFLTLQEAQTFVDNRL